MMDLFLESITVCFIVEIDFQSLPIIVKSSRQPLNKAFARRRVWPRQKLKYGAAFSKPGISITNMWKRLWQHCLSRLASDSLNPASEVCSL